MRRLTILLLLLPLLTIAAQTPGEWFVWVHIQGANRLTLLNQGGEVLNIASPTHPDEDAFAQRYFGASRNGARLVMMSSTNDARPLLIFHDLNTGAENVWFGNPGEWAMPSLTRQHTIPTLAFNPDGTLFATGVGNPGAGSWRVLVFDTNSGALLFQLDQTSPDVVGFMLTLPRPADFLLPVVRVFDSTQVHVQLLIANTEGITEYPTFSWSPGDGRIQPSEYNRAFMDVNPVSGRMVFPGVDASQPLPESFGPVPPFNAIQQVGGGPSILMPPADLVLETRWAAGDRAILAFTQNPNTFETSWKLVQPWDGRLVPLPSQIIDVQGVQDGFLSVQAGVVHFHPIDNPQGSRPLAALAPADDFHEFIWTSTVPYAGPRG